MRLNFDVDLSHHNTFGIPARTFAFAELQHWQQLETILGHPQTIRRPKLILGGGSNVLFRHDFPGLIIKICNRGISILDETDAHCFVRIAAGETWHDIVIWSVLRGLWGIENLALIPGSAGAAPIQNIGAYGAELSDTLTSVQAFDRQSEKWVTLDASDCQFGYRSSLFKDQEPDRYIVSEIILRLNKRATPQLSYPGVRHALGSANETPTPVDVAEAITRIRKAKLPDPSVFGNAGSFFKNPIVSRESYEALRESHPELKGFDDEHGVKLSAGWLIDQCGLKGMTKGEAGVFREHALVLVNLGSATGQDIWTLALQVQDAVKDRFGVILEPEPLIV